VPLFRGGTLKKSKEINMTKHKKQMIIGIAISLAVLLVGGSLLWHSYKEKMLKESESSAVKEGMFPYKIPNTSLVIQKVRPYDGVFIEDGSDRQVSGISAIVVENTGNEYIEYAKICMQCNEKPLVYELRTLGPKGVIIVQESTAAGYEKGEYSNCSAEIATMNSMEMSTSYVSIEETDTGSIRIKNISEKDIPSVRIFYKFYKSETNVLLGGITYTTKISDLKKGETREIIPSHYEKGASRIMMVRTYDTY